MADEWAEVTEAMRAIANSGPDAARRQIESDLSLHVSLDDHQATNVAVMTIERGWGACVFDEQGTGKTASTIAAFDVLVERNQADILVVVAPKSMVGEWAREFGEFTGGLYKVSLLDGTRRNRAAAIDSGSDVLVMNYETVASLSVNLRLLAQRARVVLAVDESFFVKNPDAKRTAAVRELREWCSRCFVLCGTPAPNAPHDLVAQVDLVDFGRTFDGVVLDDDRLVATNQIQRVLESGLPYLRTLKADAIPDLPKRTFTQINVQLEQQQREAYRAALQDFIVDLRSTGDATFRRRINSFLERRLALLRICSDPASLIPGYSDTPVKTLALDALVDRYVRDAGEKVIIWSFFRSSLERISRRFAEVGVARIDGTVSSVERRRETVRRFQEDDSTMVFVGNPAAAGAGLTLHRSRIAIYESFSNQAAHFLQSLDRIHRRGQDRAVEYLALIAESTLEQSEYDRLLAKADRQNELLDGQSFYRPSRELMLDELLASQRALEGDTE